MKVKRTDSSATVSRFLLCAFVLILLTIVSFEITPSNLLKSSGTIGLTSPLTSKTRLIHLAAGPALGNLGSAASVLQPNASYPATANSPRAGSGNKSQPLYTLNITNSFDGLHYGCNQGTYCTTRVPPDVQIASSPSFVLEMVNSLGEIWNKQGTVVKTFLLTSLFQADPSHVLFDPRVTYDTSSQRWFAIVSDKDDNAVKLVVSQTDDPTIGWWAYRLSLASGTWADQPVLATSLDKVVISLNDYQASNSTFIGAEYWVINKHEALFGAPLKYTSYGPDSSLSSVHPAKSPGGNNTVFMLSVEQERGYIKLFRVDGLPPSPQITSFELPVSAISSPPNATQFGSSYLLDTGDTRVLDAAWTNDTIWVTFTDGCVPHGDTKIRSCIRLIQLNADTRKILQNFFLDAVGFYYFYPTLSLDSAGDLVVAFGFSSANDYPSLALWAQPLASPNAIPSPLDIRVGGAPLVPVTSCQSNSCRYGDYFGSAIDPQTGHVWVAGEFYDKSGWATYIADVVVSRVPTTFPLTLDYQIVGGGSGYSPPVLSYHFNGEKRTELLSTLPKTYDIDLGTVANITSRLIGSTQTERWITDQQSTGIGQSANNFTFSYFHQYVATFDWITSDGTRSGNPELTVKQFGRLHGVTLNSSSAVWVDDGSPWNLSKQLNGTNPLERWYSNAQTTGLITGRFSGAFTYLHQFFLSASGDPGAGGTVSPASGWYGSGAPILLSASASPGWKFDGWQGSGLTSYTGSENSVNLNVNAPIAEIGKFFPGVTISSGSGGSVSYAYGEKSGVINESSTAAIFVPVGTKVTLTAVASSLLTPLQRWSGAANSTAGSISFTVEAPLKVKADYVNGYLIGLVVLIIVFLGLVVARMRSRRRILPEEPS